MDLLYLQALNTQLQGIIEQRRREVEIMEISNNDRMSYSGDA